MFGRAEPYKGIEEVIDCWGTQPGVSLAIIGEPLSKMYANQLRERARGRPGVHHCLQWQPEEQLRRWLAAADCVLFNYTKILTSGAACEARSYGIPILLPHRLATIDLMEPHASVFRFHAIERDFRQNLSKALSAGRDYDSAKEWREATSWRTVGRATSEIYRAMANTKPIDGAL
jgi:glycosyltransferase involved in cell wall biosynthesis